MCMGKASNLQIAKIKPLSVAFFANVLLILVRCCLENVAYIKTCVEKKTKKPSMNIQRNQPWSNSYDFHFLVSL